MAEAWAEAPIAVAIVRGRIFTNIDEVDDFFNLPNMEEKGSNIMRFLRSIV